MMSTRNWGTIIEISKIEELGTPPLPWVDMKFMNGALWLAAKTMIFFLIHPVLKG